MKTGNEHKNADPTLLRALECESVHLGEARHVEGCGL